MSIEIDDYHPHKLSRKMIIPPKLDILQEREKNSVDKEKEIWSKIDEIVNMEDVSDSTKKKMIVSEMKEYPRLPQTKSEMGFTIYKRRLLDIDHFDSVISHIALMFKVVLIGKTKVVCVNYRGKVLWSIDKVVYEEGYRKLRIRYFEAARQLCFYSQPFRRRQRHHHFHVCDRDGSIQTDVMCQEHYCSYPSFPIFQIKRNNDSKYHSFYFSEDNLSASVFMMYRRQPSDATIKYLRLNETETIPSVDASALLSS